MRVFSNISSQFVKGIKDTKLKQGVVQYAQPKDVFEKGGAVKDIAKQFRETVIKPFADFNVAGVIPKDAEKGSGYLKGILTPFTKIIEDFTKDDAEKFAKFAMGTDHLPVLTKGAKVNTDVAQFITAIEEKVGKSLGEILK